MAIELRLFEFPIGMDSKAVVLGKFRRILQFVESNEVVLQWIEVNESKMYSKLFKSFWKFTENSSEMFLILLKFQSYQDGFYSSSACN